MSTIKPRGSLVTVRMIEKREQKMASGIIIPVTGGQIFELATIVDVGPGAPDMGHMVGTNDLRTGMTVLIKAGERTGQIGQAIQSLLTLDSMGGKVSLINQADILAIIEEDQVMIPMPVLSTVAPPRIAGLLPAGPSNTKNFPRVPGVSGQMIGGEAPPMVGDDDHTK